MTTTTNDGWIDCSVPLYSGMVHWPDNPPITIERVMNMDDGAVCNLSLLSFGAHTGTHMDAPLHFIPGQPGIDAMPLAVGIGPARVIAITNTTAITRGELEPHRLLPGERVLFQTRNSFRAWQTDRFIEDFVGIEPDAATFLAECQVALVGVDYLSVGPFASGGPETHRAILGGGVWVVEGLNLSAVPPGPVDLICLPLRIRDGDGAPARAIVRPRSA